MSQLNIYVPDQLEKQVKNAAKKRHMSVSAFIADLIKQSLVDSQHPNANETLLDLGGAWKGSFPEVNRGLPQEREE